MGVQGGWVGQKGSKKHVRNIWTAPWRIVHLYTSRIISGFNKKGVVVLPL